MHEADVCPDTEHVLNDCSWMRMRVTTWLANYRRGITKIEEWLPQAAARC
ncbi:hypothetical protein T492DRAFT_876088 [Pavlovales sp. CCMP2436]|nr:hypothetical protein T492DRAFT_876088 [Pavlovales sp. CCMP2436]